MRRAIGPAFRDRSGDPHDVRRLHDLHLAGPDKFTGDYGEEGEEVDRRRGCRHRHDEPSRLVGPKGVVQSCEEFPRQTLVVEGEAEDASRLVVVEVHQGEGSRVGIQDEIASWLRNIGWMLHTETSVPRTLVPEVG